MTHWTASKLKAAVYPMIPLKDTDWEKNIDNTFN